MIKGEDWDAARVLDHGLPRPPTVLSPQDEVPVALWRRGRIGAVLWITYDPDDHRGAYAQDIEIWFQELDSSWRWLSTAGSDWPAVYGERPTGNPVLTFAAGATNPEDGQHVLVASGVAPLGVQRVRLEGTGEDDVSNVELLTGAFLLRAQEDDIGSYSAVLDACSPPGR